MVRVADANQSQVLLAELMRTKQTLGRTERMVSTGKQVENYKEVAGDIQALTSAKSVLKKTEQFEANTQEVARQLEVQNLNLTEVYNAADSIRQQITEALTNGEAQAFDANLTSAFDQVVSQLNTQFGGKYIYGGTLTDQPPMAITDINALVAAPNAAAAFQGNTLEKSVRIDEGIVMTPGFMAQDVGEDLLTVVRDLKDYNDNTAAFQGPLTPAQITELENQLTAIDAVLEELRVDLVVNGDRQNTVDDTLRRHEATRITLTTVISDIEDADMAEAITKLNQDQLALEASMRVLSQLNDLTLMNFL